MSLLLGSDGFDLEEAWREFEEERQDARADVDARDRSASDAAEIAALAALAPLEYDRLRAGVAKRLGVGVSALDTAIKQARAGSRDGDGAEASGGYPVQLRETEPCAEAVDGAEVLTDIANIVSRRVALPDGAARRRRAVDRTHLLA